MSVLLSTDAQGEGAATASVPLAEVVVKNAIQAKSTGRDRLRLVLTNPTAGAMSVKVPAGTIFRGANGARIITLRSAGIDVPSHGSVEAEIPIAALSSRDAVGMQPFTLTGETEPKLAKLLEVLATQDDIPRTTSQLAVLALLEDPSYGQWLQFLAAMGESSGNKSDVVIQAIDTLGLLKTLEPERTFALAKDNELKLRALRNPIARPKAVQIYGLSLPDDPALPSASVPSLKQLLHTQPGDNCPTCRMRERAGRGAGDF